MRGIREVKTLLPDIRCLTWLQRGGGWWEFSWRHGNWATILLLNNNNCSQLQCPCCAPGACLNPLHRSTHWCLTVTLKLGPLAPLLVHETPGNEVNDLHPSTRSRSALAQLRPRSKAAHKPVSTSLGVHLLHLT